MCYSRTRATLLIITTAFVPATLLADVPAAQRPEVEHLITFVEKSRCTLLRNGSNHDGTEAADHIRKKYGHFRDKISNTEEFIELAASRSASSGKEYLVSCPGEATLKSRDWLLQELQRYRRK